EIGELSLDVQVSLLRFLEGGEYSRLGEPILRRADVRIVAATNRELAAPTFRDDLRYRLTEVEIRVPPLRERLADIVPLAPHFGALYGGLNGPRLSSEAAEALLEYSWPGNVRQLENLMKRLAGFAVSDTIGPDEVKRLLQSENQTSPNRVAPIIADERRQNI